MSNLPTPPAGWRWLDVGERTPFGALCYPASSFDGATAFCRLMHINSVLSEATNPNGYFRHANGWTGSAVTDRIPVLAPVEYCPPARPIVAGYTDARAALLTWIDARPDKEQLLSGSFGPAPYPVSRRPPANIRQATITPLPLP